MSRFKSAMQAIMKKGVGLAPDRWIPGGVPDPLIARAKNGSIGTALSRIDGPLKVQGHARFAAEFDIENMTYAALAYSTIPKGRIAALDVAAAEASPGVLLVMTHHNCPRLKPTPVFLSDDKAAGGSDLPVMQDECIYWNGQPIALVLAETHEQAQHAASLIRATYVEEPAETCFAQAKKHARHVEFQGEPLQVAIGDAEEALAAAPFAVDSLYETPRHNHNAIELHAATLVWDGDDLRLHDAIQFVAHTAWTLAQIFGLDESQVHVSSPYVGGGFGGKTLWWHQILAAAAARLAKRPVRVMLSREGVYRLVGGRANTEQRVALGADTDGKFKALIHTGYAAMTTHNAMPEPFILPAMSMYGAEAIKLDVQVADLDMLANTFMRAPGESVGTFALESAIDELAERMGIDPIELRLRNEPEKDPVNGLPFSARHSAQAWRDGAERFGWADRNARPGMRREGEWLVGMGAAGATYPYYRMPGSAARLTLRRDGHVTVDVAAHEMGMGTATVHTQVTADRLGLFSEQVTVNYGDTSLPGTILAGGSQQTAAVGAAVRAAFDAMVAELLKLAGNTSPLAGLKPSEIEGRDGGLGKIGDPAAHESYAAILARAQREELQVEAKPAMPLEIMHWSMHSHGAMFCEVRVNAISGEPRVRRFLGSFDCGRILNPKTAASQFRGGMIMGLGLALTEEAQFDERKGRIMNASLSDYHLPVHMDVPKIEVMWTDIPDPHTPMGARGIGEIGITGTAAAIANAVYNATGKRVRSLPITLDKLI
ncbi:xanthine dehydrogenase YagR molybdenum-binding subunit [Sphingobium sp. AP50]|nr:xanthine dehydrogenase YagR molybdenum-binding subunit [Sphingobium sp. AP50]